MVPAVFRVPRAPDVCISPRPSASWKVIALGLALFVSSAVAHADDERIFSRQYGRDDPTMVLSRLAVRAYEEKSSQWPERDLLPVALAYYVTRDYSKADSLFEQVRTREPENLFAMLGCGASLTNLEKYEQAAPLLRQVWEKTQKVEALVQLATCYHKLGRKPELEALVPDLITYKYEDLDETLGALCSYALLVGDEKKARETLDRALAGVPDRYIASNYRLALQVRVALQRFDLQDRAASIQKAAQAQTDE